VQRFDKAVPDTKAVGDVFRVKAVFIVSKAKLFVMTMAVEEALQKFFVLAARYKQNVVPSLEKG
jgi:hypothetical protein